VCDGAFQVGVAAPGYPRGDSLQVFQGVVMTWPRPTGLTSPLDLADVAHFVLGQQPPEHVQHLYGDVLVDKYPHQAARDPGL